MTTVAPTTTTPPPATGTAGDITSAQQTLAGDQKTFLTLLTAQLQNQDPLSPMDPSQFTQQLVAMTGVQQQILTNQLLQQMNGNQSGIGDPVSLLGKTVTASTASNSLQGGQASWLYSLGAPASKVNFQVTDALGNLVWQQDAGSAGAGEHSLSWNGQDLNGNQLPDGGTYTLQVTATDASGTTLTSSVYQRGPATAVQQQGGSTLITVGGAKVPLSSITTVAAS